MPQPTTTNQTSKNIYQASSFDLLQIIGSDSDLKLKAKTDGGEYWGNCPFCGNAGPNSDRFHVWPHSKTPRFWCRVCGKHGNVFNYIMEKHNVGFVEALKILNAQPSSSNYTPRSLPVRTPPSVSILSDVTISTDLVERLHNTNLSLTTSYWKKWHISEATINLYRLGYVDELVNGTRYHGFTIPHWWTTDFGAALKAVKVRSADISPLHKYLSFGSSITRGVFNDYNTSAPDSSRLGPLLDFCFIVEDERTAMMLDQFYPTVAYFPETSWNQFLPQVFQNVGVPIIIADNDGDHGVQRALQVKEYLAGKECMIFKPRTHKQLSDMAADLGIDAVHDWVSHNIPGLRPVERRTNDFKNMGQTQEVTTTLAHAI